MTEAVIRVRVPFVDVDSSQRIHFTAMFRYMEVAEHTLMRNIGFPYATALRELAFPRVRLSCDFKGAILFDDVLDVTARVQHVGVSSWTVAFFARRAPTGHARSSEGNYGELPSTSHETLAEGHMTIVAMDPTSERATPLPHDLRRALLGDALSMSDDER